ncbi:uncharacterized protein LOC128712319 [Anopheles marshallii]|uniref:uncharacterized protein LOC128712319 n=1 Tax=Anopheles marshallii TaxID=1521116 RepID=UPI00237C0B18|nr:uncharacterized protein LOC128712319 [Anopheles marshallii]
MSDSPPDDIESRYLYVLDEAERLRVHIAWMHSYQQYWGQFDSMTVYLRQQSWEFMRINIQYVTDTWAHLTTLINSNDPPELRALLHGLEQFRSKWDTAKTFLESVIQRSERLYTSGLVV